MSFQYFSWAGNPGDNCDLCGRTTRRGFIEIPMNPIGQATTGGKILCEMCGKIRKENINV